MTEMEEIPTCARADRSPTKRNRRAGDPAALNFSNTRATDRPRERQR
jgi:hypothetical protein